MALEDPSYCLVEVDGVAGMEVDADVQADGKAEKTEEEAAAAPSAAQALRGLFPATSTDGDDRGVSGMADICLSDSEDDERDEVAAPVTAAPPAPSPDRPTPQPLSRRQEDLELYQQQLKDEAERRQRFR